MNIKLVVILFIFPVLFSCNNATHKKDGSSYNDNTSTDGSEQGSNPHLRYFANETNVAKIICQNWEQEDDLNQLKDMEGTTDLEIPFRSFYISSDGSFVKNPRMAMEYGNWEYDDEAKILTFNYKDAYNKKRQNYKDVYKIMSVAADELNVRNRQLNTATLLKFVSEGTAFKDPTQEPFHISNNLWRIPPTAPETDTAIRSRLKANLHFFIMYYKNAIEKELKFVPFYGLPGCLKWYGGAIYIQKPEELDKNWVACFYNEAQAMKAYKIMDEVMSKKYNWPKDEGNWLKLNLAVLEQIYKNVDSVQN